MKKLVSLLVTFLLFCMPCAVLADTEEESEARSNLELMYNDFFISEYVADKCFNVETFESIYVRAQDAARQIKERCLQEQGNTDFCDTQYLHNIEDCGRIFIRENADHITRIDCPNSSVISSIENMERMSIVISRFSNLVYINLEGNRLRGRASIFDSVQNVFLKNNELNGVDITEASQLEHIEVDEGAYFKMLKGGSSFSKLVDNHWTEISYTNLFHSYWDDGKYILDQFNNNPVSLKTTSQVVNDLLSSSVPSHVTVSYKDNEENILGANDYIGTGSTLNLSAANVQQEYTILILGDVTGSGDVSVADVAKTYQHYKKRKLMDSLYTNGRKKLNMQSCSKI